MAELSSAFVHRGAGLPVRAFQAASASTDRGPQTVADLLLLGALAFRAPTVLWARPELGGGWSVEFGGQDRCPPLETELFSRFCALEGPVEIPDLADALPGSQLIAFPSSMRWAYGAAIRDSRRQVLAVLVVLDRWLRKLNRQEVQVLRLLTAQLNDAVLVASARPATEPVPVWQMAPEAAVVLREPARPEVRRFPFANRLLRSREVAALFDVSDRTVLNWVSTGRLPAIRTAGGHLRFNANDIQALMTIQ